MATRDKKKVNTDEEEAKDRLSDLPDCLLLHILSFLPETKLSVRTCVLSKRWKCLWTSLSDLVFYGWERIPLFKKFVHKVLSGRNNIPLRKFYFSYPGRDKALITRIINYAISHDVQHFGISLHSSLSILFPLFNGCCSLKTLKLEYFYDLILLSDISLPTLTTLHISEWKFYPVSIHSMDPFVGFVNLKSLRLESCGMHVGVFKISGTQLHILTLCQYSLSRGCMLEIFAPKLHSFEFIETYLDFPLLEIADVYINDACKEIPLFPLINMFQGLSHAQSLYLSSRTIEVLTKFPGLLEGQVSPFGGLKTLIVRSHRNPLTNIPDNVMNYFVQGTIFGPNLSIKIAESTKVQNLLPNCFPETTSAKQERLCNSKFLIFDWLIKRSEHNQWD